MNATDVPIYVWVRQPGQASTPGPAPHRPANSSGNTNVTNIAVEELFVLPEISDKDPEVGSRQ